MNLGGIRIHKVIVKGGHGIDAAAEGMHAQTLLVVGSARPRSSDTNAPCVGMNRDDPGQSLGPGFEQASFVDREEILRYDPKSPKSPTSPTAGEMPFKPFDIVLAEEERYWLARFDFPDHRDLEGAWNALIRTIDADSNVMLPVVAWWPEDRDDPVQKRFRLKGSDVVAAPLFDLGVLFVHGIGKHRVRETLLRFGEPLVLFWEAWFKECTIQGGRRWAAKDPATVRKHFSDGVLHNRQDHEGLTRIVDAFCEEVERYGGTKGDGAENALLCGGVCVEDTLFMTPGSDTPSSTLLRFAELRGDGSLREAHVLLSEAWWTEVAVPPTLKELRRWIWTALPIVLQRHLHFIVRSWYDDLGCRSDDQSCDAYRAHIAAKRMKCLWGLRRLLDAVIGGVEVLILLPLLFAGGVLAQTLLTLVGLISLIPIRWLRTGVGWLIASLMGTVGQSHALKTSAVRRNVMVREVMKDFEWLAPRCRRMVVVSHSQGAEIARQVFQFRRWGSVARWVTFGAGIGPLAALEEQHRSDPAHWWAIRIMGTGTVATLALLGGGLLAAVYGGDWGPWQELIALLSTWRPLAGVALACLGVALGLALCSRPRPLLRFSKASLAVMRDQFASHDPVSAGSLFDAYADDLKKNGLSKPMQRQRLFNRRSRLLDHTSYFDNIEQFVAPLALEIYGLAGLRDCVDAAQPHLKQAAERRDWTTWLRAQFRMLALALVALTVWQAACGADGHWGHWWKEGVSIWNARLGDEAGGWRGSWALLKSMLYDLRWTWLVLLCYLAARGLVLAVQKRSAAALRRNLAAVLLESADAGGDGRPRR